MKKTVNWVLVGTGWIVNNFLAGLKETLEGRNGDSHQFLNPPRRVTGTFFLLQAYYH